MKLSELTTEEIRMVADELDNKQFAIKVDLNENGRTYDESRIKVLKATRNILKKEAFAAREKSIVVKVKEEEAKDEN